jgi:hypothetical protein
MVRDKIQTVTAVQEWRERMRAARKNLPEAVGQQDVLAWLVTKNPALDRLIYATRWRNAWNCKNADPEFTILVEAAATHFVEKAKSTSNRLSRQKLKKVQ